MAGVKVQKRYVSSNLSSSALTNNWTVLVFGVTNEGPTEATLIQSYEVFLTMFGQPVKGVKTHNYVRFLVNSGVNVLFKRIIDKDHQTLAKSETSSLGLTITATDSYIGEAGNKISCAVLKGEDNINRFVIYYGDDGSKQKDKIVETYDLGIDVPGKSVFKQFCVKNNSNTEDVNFSKYITIKLTGADVADETWNATIVSNEWSAVLAGGGEGNVASLSYALSVLEHEDISECSFWTDRKVKQAITYYPNLRFVTTGGILDDTDVKKNEQIFKNLGKLSASSNYSFRVLLDYPFDTVDVKDKVRAFAQAEASSNVSASAYAYFGDWGSDDTGMWLPGSAGFLSALGLSGYNVYNRRIAGRNFKPAYSNINTEIYLDELEDWQSETNIQLNPICIVDSQDNLAVMGSSTLAMPQTLSRNPEQALDIVLVGDYITALLNDLAYNMLEVALDRLTVTALSNNIDSVLNDFVTSGAITRYDVNIDTTVIGTLGINVTLYFAIGLEEVQLVVTSVYDTEAAQLISTETGTV